MKAAGTHWGCYLATNFYGWEAHQVVVVASAGNYIIEQITRAKTKLYVVLMDGCWYSKSKDSAYSRTKGYFQQAAEELGWLKL